MEDLTRKQAHKILEEGAKLNNGAWVKHSINAAKAAERLAEALELDKDKAYIYGLLHDIGRSRNVEKTYVRHIIDGYNYMKSIGHEEIGRYCLTHSFMIKDIHTILGKWDMTEDETEFVISYLNNIEYTLYDKIVQLSDYMALPNQITLVERRIMHVYLRYDFDIGQIDVWKALFRIQAEIEEKLGCSIYKLFPEIKQDISKYMIKDVLTF